MADDDTALSLQHFITTTPSTVLQCALDLLQLPNVLDAGFPPAEEFRSNKANGIAVNALQSTTSVLNERGGQPPQALDSPFNASHSLFEVVVRLMYVVSPRRLEEFVSFAADVCDVRKETYLRAVRALPGSGADVSDDSARVKAALHTTSGDPCAAIDRLALNGLWDDCIAMTEQLADGGMMHVQVFQLLLQRMLEGGVFPARGLPLLRNTALAPPTFTAADLFELFAQATSVGKVTTSSDPEKDLAVGAVREYLTEMMAAHRPRDLAAPYEPLVGEMV
jgi:hypothetical protein